MVDLVSLSRGNVQGCATRERVYVAWQCLPPPLFCIREKIKFIYSTFISRQSSNCVKHFYGVHYLDILHVHRQWPRKYHRFPVYPSNVSFFHAPHSAQALKLLCTNPEVGVIRLTCNQFPQAEYGCSLVAIDPVTVPETRVMAISLLGLWNVKCLPWRNRPLETMAWII